MEAEEPDAEDIQAKSQTLMEVSMKLGQAMYEQSQTEEGAAEAGTEGEETIVDADFEEVDGDDDEKKSA